MPEQDDKFEERLIWLENTDSPDLVDRQCAAWATRLIRAYRVEREAFCAWTQGRGNLKEDIDALAKATAEVERLEKEITK